MFLVSWRAGVRGFAATLTMHTRTDHLFTLFSLNLFHWQLNIHAYTFNQQLECYYSIHIHTETDLVSSAGPGAGQAGQTP